MINLRIVLLVIVVALRILAFAGNNPLYVLCEFEEGVTEPDSMQFVLKKNGVNYQMLSVTSIDGWASNISVEDGNEYTIDPIRLRGIETTVLAYGCDKFSEMKISSSVFTKSGLAKLGGLPFGTEILTVLGWKRILNIALNEWVVTDYATNGYFFLVKNSKNMSIDDGGLSGKSNPASYCGIYDGIYHGISVNVVSPDSGYDIVYAENENGPYISECPKYKDVCEKTIWYIVSAPGYLAITNNATVVITERDISKANILSIPPQAWSGRAIEPKPALTDIELGRLHEGVDLTWQYLDNVEQGTATAIVQGIGNYKGRLEQSFDIERLRVKNVVGEKNWASEMKATVMATLTGTTNMLYYLTVTAIDFQSKTNILVKTVKSQDGAFPNGFFLVNRGNYHFEWDVKADHPNGLCVKKIAMGVKLNPIFPVRPKVRVNGNFLEWDPIPGAVRYEIWRASNVFGWQDFGESYMTWEGTNTSVEAKSPPIIHPKYGISSGISWIRAVFITEEKGPCSQAITIDLKEGIH